MTYINSFPRPSYGQRQTDDGMDWWEFTLKRLAWLYGPERTAAIIAGHDPATNADLAAWRTIGRPG